MTLPTDPTREGYHFAGWWYKEATTYTKKFVNSGLTEDATVYAMWKTYATSVYVNGIDITNGEYWKNEDKTTASGSPSDYNFHYDKSTGELTLNNATVSGTILGEKTASGSFSGCVLAKGGDVTLNLMGTNTLTPANISTEGSKYCGIYINGGDLTVQGTGTLNTPPSGGNTYYIGVVLQTGNIYVTGGTINATGKSGGVIAFNTFAPESKTGAVSIGTPDDMGRIVMIGGTVNAVVTDGEWGYAYACDGNFTVSGTDANFNADATFGIYSDGYGHNGQIIIEKGHTIKDSAGNYTITGFEKDQTQWTGAFFQSYGLVTCEKGVLTKVQQTAPARFIYGDEQNNVLTGRAIIGQPITLPDISSYLTNATLSGWYTLPNGGGTQVTSTTPITSKMLSDGLVLFASLTKNGPDKRTSKLELSRDTVSYATKSGSKTDIPTNSAITDTNEGWAWYPDASTSYDKTKNITADNHPAKTLILDHADIETNSDIALIVPDGTTIVVKSDSTVKATGAQAASAIMGGLYPADAVLTITGDGKLTAENTKMVIVANKLVLKNAQIDASATNVASEKENPGAICANVGIDIIGGNVKATAAGTQGYGLYVNDGTISITDNATVNTSGVSKAIFAKTITIDSALSITAPSGGKLSDTKDNIFEKDGTTVAKSVTIAPNQSSGGNTGGSSSSSSSTTTKPTGTTDSTVVVDGKSVSAGKVTTNTNTDGTKTNTVAVDSTTLEKQVTSADIGSSVVVTVPESTGAAKTQLVAKDVEILATKNMTLEITTGNVTYTVPADAIDTAEVAKTLGATDTAKIPVTVTITPVKKSDVTVPVGTQIAAPVKFEVTATYNGKTTEITKFDSYVARVIAIPFDVDASKITTGIRIEDSKHVPTSVFRQSGRYYAKINSLTNSTYTVVYNTASFADAAGKWYEKAVTEMASREVINGKTSAAFAGDESITRAEFAAILTRALGLPSGGTNSFSDVSSDAWCYDSVGAAVQYGIIKGYTDGSFKPNANITREEAMVMMQRAAKVAGYTGTTGSLTGFSDASDVGGWAKSAVEFNVGSGLIQGNGGKLNPKSNITRAETAVVVLRQLQKANLIDVRTNV